MMQDCQCHVLFESKGHPYLLWELLLPKASSCKASFPVNQYKMNSFDKVVNTAYTVNGPLARCWTVWGLVL